MTILRNWVRESILTVLYEQKSKVDHIVVFVRRRSKKAERSWNLHHHVLLFTTFCSIPGFKSEGGKSAKEVGAQNTLSFTHTLSLSHTHTNKHTHTLTHTHTHTHTRTHKQTNTQTHRHMFGVRN